MQCLPSSIYQNELIFFSFFVSGLHYFLIVCLVKKAELSHKESSLQERVFQRRLFRLGQCVPRRMGHVLTGGGGVALDSWEDSRGGALFV